MTACQLDMIYCCLYWLGLYIQLFKTNLPFVKQTQPFVPPVLGPVELPLLLQALVSGTPPAPADDRSLFESTKLRTVSEHNTRGRGRVPRGSKKNAIGELYKAMLAG